MYHICTSSTQKLIHMDIRYLLHNRNYMQRQCQLQTGLWWVLKHDT